jgi:hypothetical protein
MDRDPRIASTERQMLEFVRDEFGAGKITAKRTYSSRHTPSFCFAVTSRQALNLLRQLEPFLRSYKRERAALALRHYESLTPRNGKYTPRILAARRRFERQLLSLRPAPDRSAAMLAPARRS